MVTPGEVYAAVTVILLLVALAVAVPVLRQIVLDGIERRRKWKTGEMEQDSDGEEDDRGAASRRDDERAQSPRQTCRHCGTENDPDFSHCRKCARPL